MQRSETMHVLHHLKCLAYGIIALAYLAMMLGVHEPWLYLVIGCSYLALFCAELGATPGA